MNWIGWDPIVPVSYIQLQVNVRLECICNLARLCKECVVLWRQRVHSMQLELAAVCEASLDVPKWIQPSQYDQVCLFFLFLLPAEKNYSKAPVLHNVFPPPLYVFSLQLGLLSLILRAARSKKEARGGSPAVHLLRRRK